MIIKLQVKDFLVYSKKKSKKSFSVFGKLVRKFESGLGPGAKLTEYLLMLWRTNLAVMMF